jgi:hypothetical protein
VARRRRTNSEQAGRRRSIDSRREQRELLFWTLRESLAIAWLGLRLIVLAALAIYLILAMLDGRSAGAEEVMRLF